jgi:uncharacterized membrane protein (UPF0182 family)
MKERSGPRHPARRWRGAASHLRGRTPDPPHYGQLIVFELPKGWLALDPAQVKARINQPAHAVGTSEDRG